MSILLLTITIINFNCVVWTISILLTFLLIEWWDPLRNASRSNHRRCSVKKVFLEMSPMACHFIKKEILIQVFSCEFCEILRTRFLTEHLRWLLLGVSYCCFRKAVSKNYFQKVLLIHFISTYANWLKNFSFALFLLIEGYGNYSLRNESLIAPFVERFKTAALRKSSWLISLTAIYLKLLVLLTF